MSLLKRLFGKDEPDPKQNLMPLYHQVVAHAREPHWYVAGAVPDSIDGRFDMVAAIMSLVVLRLESDAEYRAETAYLTELFVDDMDGQLREIGIGDMIVGKHVGRIMGALGGRLGAFREGLEDHSKLDGAILRNIYRADTVSAAPLDHVRQNLLSTAAALAAEEPSRIVSGEGRW